MYQRRVPGAGHPLQACRKCPALDIAIIWPLFLLALVAGFVLLWVWGAQNGQFETIGLSKPL